MTSDDGGKDLRRRSLHFESRIKIDKLFGKMSAALPRPIQSYLDASNAHNVQSILTCFAADAMVRDENTTHRGTWKTDSPQHQWFQEQVKAGEKWKIAAYRVKTCTAAETRNARKIFSSRR